MAGTKARNPLPPCSTRRRWRVLLFPCPFNFFGFKIDFVFFTSLSFGDIHPRLLANCSPDSFAVFLSPPLPDFEGWGALLFFLPTFLLPGSDFSYFVFCNDRKAFFFAFFPLFPSSAQILLPRFQSNDLLGFSLYSV